MKNKFYLNGIPVYRIILEDNKRKYRLYEDVDTGSILITSGKNSEIMDWQLVLEVIQSDFSKSVKSLSKVNESLEIIV